MKKTLLYISALAFTLGLSSCGDDFLSEEPSSSVPVEGYYTTNSKIFESLVAAYDPMEWYDCYYRWSALNFVSDCMGDDIYVGGGSTTDASYLHLISQYRSDASNNIPGAWITSYTGINRSNLLIKNANNSTEITESERSLYDAEGRALRAWYYLVLWKLWGNVPYYEENLTYPYLARQYTEKEVYDAVTADLEKVLDSNVLPMSQTDEWKGRMTQAACAMIYADYVMYQADESKYAKALSYMEDIINSGEYKLVTIDELWDVTNEWNDEIIFDINYCAKNGERSWSSIFLTGGTVFPQLIGIDGYTSTETTPEFATGGWGFCTVSKEVYDDYEDGDLRRDASILNIDEYIKQKSEEGYLIYYNGRYQNTGFFLKKYLPRTGGNDGYNGSDALNWDYNLHLYRYAETLLNAAELALETGDKTKAQNYYNQVRARAGVSSREVTIDNLIDERRLEFVGEGKRYYDLVRTGKAASVLKAGGGVLLQSKGYYFEDNVKDLSHLRFRDASWGGQAIPERQNWNENKKYIQIPQSEIEATAAKGEEYALIQNPS
ncbi:MAG: RagB/SusD family nutrient uptake outer membrane protein [Prevotella sp.]|jgi:hypothetical protein